MLRYILPDIETVHGPDNLTENIYFYISEVLVTTQGKIMYYVIIAVQLSLCLL